MPFALICARFVTEWFKSRWDGRSLGVAEDALRGDTEEGGGPGEGLAGRLARELSLVGLVALHLPGPAAGGERAERGLGGRLPGPGGDAGGGHRLDEVGGMGVVAHP